MNYGALHFMYKDDKSSVYFMKYGNWRKLTNAIIIVLVQIMPKHKYTMLIAVSIAWIWLIIQEDPYRLKIYKKMKIVSELIFSLLISMLFFWEFNSQKISKDHYEKLNLACTLVLILLYAWEAITTFIVLRINVKFVEEHLFVIWLLDK